MLNILILIFIVSFANLVGFAASIEPKTRPLVASPAEDRENYAPTKVSLYVLDEKKKCFVGSFSDSSAGKVLALDKDKAVSVDHCIYQKKFNKEPRGYTLLERGGGLCKRSYSASLEDLSEGMRDALRIDENTVSISECLERTVSYGEVLEKRVSEAAHSTSLSRVPASEKTTDPTSENETKPHKKSSQIFTVQMFSLTNLEEANLKIKNLSKVGVKAFTTEHKIGSKNWYRVCSGKFKSAKAALAEQKNLASKKGLLTAIVIKLDKI